MNTNFDDIIRQVLGIQQQAPDDGSVQQVGDVVPFVGGRMPANENLPRRWGATNAEDEALRDSWMKQWGDKYHPAWSPGGFRLITPPEN